MKILVLIKSVLDTKIPLEYAENTGRLRDGWNVPVLNPDDCTAVVQALKIKKERDTHGKKDRAKERDTHVNKEKDTHIMVVHLGPPSGDRFIREALALGCDEGLRVWDEGLEDLHTKGKLLIFSRIATILGFDILFTGTKSLDTGSSQLGVLLASALQVPYITRVSGIDSLGERTLTATRRLERGYQQQVESTLPLVVAMTADDELPNYASFPSVARAADSIIPCIDLSRIGIPLQAVRRAEFCLKHGPLRQPEPAHQFIQPPDSSLSAFERRARLGEGIMKKRQGRIVRGEGSTVTEELFQELKRKGWLDHLRKESDRV